MYAHVCSRMLTPQVVWCGTGMVLRVETLDAHLMAEELSVMANRAKAAQQRQAQQVLYLLVLRLNLPALLVQTYE
jgi:hypothetical protein